MVRRVAPLRHLALAGLAILGFIVGVAKTMPALAVATKPIPVLCLADWVLGAGTRGSRFIAAGLVFSAVGDVALELGDAPQLFMAGMLAFALAHAAYVVAFVTIMRRAQPALLAPFALWGLALFYWIRPGLGALLVPVAIYALLLVAMMWRAAASGLPFAAVGAVLFGLSDSLIALGRFHAPIPGARWLVMALYWAGQWGIARSFAGASSTASR